MQNTQRQVLALIETSSDFGRGVLKGVLNYTQTLASKNMTPWHVRLEPCNVCEKVPGDFASWHGDGIISQSNSTDIYRQLQKKKIPIVELLNNDIPSGVDIDFDFEEIAKIAAMHFCDRGLTNIAWYAVNNVWWCNRLRDFFVQELRKQDRRCFVYPDDVSTEYEYHRPYWNDARRKSLIKWLKKLTYPVGILAASDMLAERIIEACKELELDVPNQVAVLGVSNDSLMCSLSSPQLSSIDLDAERYGYLAAELLDKKMNSRKNENSAAEAHAPIVVPPKGAVARHSTDTVATTDPYCIEAIEFIRKHYTEKISAVDVANSVKLSRAMLDRRFLASFGRTINKVITRLRMEKAEFLLLQTDQKIGQVAANSGFNCYEYFFRAFQQRHNMTPEDFRSKN